MIISLVMNMAVIIISIMASRLIKQKCYMCLWSVCVVQMWLLELRTMMKEREVSTFIRAHAMDLKTSLHRFKTTPSLLPSVSLLASQTRSVTLFMYCKR